MPSNIKIKSKHAVISLVMIAALLGINYDVNKYQSVQQLNKIRQLVTNQFHLDPKTKITGCQVSGAMPDHSCTPGSVFANVTVLKVCTSGYSSTVRNVSTNEKDQVYAEYGITAHTSGQYEVDHFISLELGGSNDIANLWPEAAAPVPGFHQKDEIENYLHTELCSGQLSLAEAQYLISYKWLDVYKLLHP